MPFQGEFYDCPPTQGDALGYVLMAFQAVSMHGFHYFRNPSYLSKSENKCGFEGFIRIKVVSLHPVSYVKKI